MKMLFPAGKRVEPGRVINAREGVSRFTIF